MIWREVSSTHPCRRSRLPGWSPWAGGAETGPARNEQSSAKRTKLHCGSRWWLQWQASSPGTGLAPYTCNKMYPDLSQIKKSGKSTESVTMTNVVLMLPSSFSPWRKVDLYDLNLKFFYILCRFVLDTLYSWNTFRVEFAEDCTNHCATTTRFSCVIIDIGLPEIRKWSATEPFIQRISYIDRGTVFGKRSRNNWTSLY